MFRLFSLNKAALSQFLSFLPFPQTSRTAGAAVAAGCLHSFALYGQMSRPGTSSYGTNSAPHWSVGKGAGPAGSLIVKANFSVVLFLPTAVTEPDKRSLKDSLIFLPGTEVRIKFSLQRWGAHVGCTWSQTGLIWVFLKWIGGFRY